MPDTITLLGSLAGLDMQAVVGQPVWVRVHHAPDGKLLGGTEPPGTVLGEPGYAPTGYGSTRSLVTDEQGLFGGVLPWEDGGIYRVDVPGDVTRYLMMGTGAGEYPAGSTVNVRLLPGPDEVVTPSVTLDALVGDAVEDYLTAHPPAGQVVSVAGRTGAVSLAKADVGLGGVDNTSDADKPVSTAQQAAIDGKVSASIVDTKGDLIAATANDTVARLPVGANGQVLTADSTQATGLKWAAPSGGNPITYGNTTVTDAQLNLGAGSVVSVADRIGAAFLPVPYAITSIGVSVSTAVSRATGDLVLYTRSDGTFTRHTNFGSIGLSTTGLKTLTGSWTLPAGEFWIGVLGTSAATGAALNGMPVPSNVPIPIRDPGNGGAVAVVGFTAGAGAVPPAAFTTSSYGPYWQGNPPAIYFRGGPA